MPGGQPMAAPPAGHSSSGPILQAPVLPTRLPRFPLIFPVWRMCLTSCTALVLPPVPQAAPACCTACPSTSCTGPSTSLPLGPSGATSRSRWVGGWVVNWGCLASCLAGKPACPVHVCVNRCRQATLIRSLTHVRPPSLNFVCRHVAAGAGRGLGSSAGAAAQHGPRRRCAFPACLALARLLHSCMIGRCRQLCNKCLAAPASLLPHIPITVFYSHAVLPARLTLLPAPPLPPPADVWANPVSYDKLGVRYRRWRNSGGCWRPFRLPAAICLRHAGLAADSRADCQLCVAAPQHAIMDRPACMPPPLGWLLQWHRATRAPVLQRRRGCAR